MKPLLIAFLAGLAAALGFEPVGVWPLTLLAIGALLWLVERAPRLRSALALGWAFGLGYFTLGLNWIATAFTYQAAMPAWLGWIAVVLLSLYLAVYPALAAGLAWRWGRGDRLAFALVFAAGWIVSEWLRSTMFTGFAWNPVGVALLPTVVAGVARIVGTYALSGIAVLISGALLLLLARRWRSAAALLGPVVLLSLAAWAMSAPAGNSPLALRIVQPNIGQEDKWREGFEQENYTRLSQLTFAPAAGPRLVLWPEVAVTYPLEDARQAAMYRESAAEMGRSAGAALGPQDLLLTGGLSLRSNDGFTVSAETNSVFAIERSGRILARYDKSHLVPYGEYLPMRPLLSAIGLSRLAPGAMDFAAGPGPRTIALPLVGKVGFQLCYEMIFSGEVIDRRNRPAFLFNPSNDAWFGRWGPPQHLAQARMRALEEGVPVLRSTPTGISAVIDSDGRLVSSIPWREAGAIDSRLPLPKAPTPFARIGNLAAFLVALLLAAAAIAVRRKAR